MIDLHRLERKPLPAFTGPVRPTYAVDRGAWDGPPRHVPVVIVGAGMTGLTAALDLASRGIASVLVDDGDTVSSGSRSISQAKRSLEIWGRLGVGPRLVDDGVVWTRGHVGHGDRLLQTFDLQPDAGERYPAFINLPQWRVEARLVETAMASPLVDLRWKSRVTGLTQDATRVVLAVDTPDGPRTIEADWLVAADGVRSSVRQHLGLSFDGEKAEGRFLIADVRLGIALPPERHFWFDPTFHDGTSVLMHRQPDGLWRVDWEIGAGAEREVELSPESLARRIRRMFGDVDFEVVWASVYQFDIRRVERFRVGRVLFAGDAAHQLSPFGGGRGGNLGVQDADNLAWKLADVVAGRADARLLDTYDRERGAAADENITISRRSSRFIAPRSPATARMRAAVLAGAGRVEGFDAYVNTGRLSRANRLPMADDGGEGHALGTAAFDAPVAIDGRRGWLSDWLGRGFCLLVGGDDAATDPTLRELGRDFEARHGIGLKILVVDGKAAEGDEAASGLVHLHDVDGLVMHRYRLLPWHWYLVRPDTNVVGKGHKIALAAIFAAFDASTGCAYRPTQAPVEAIGWSAPLDADAIYEALHDAVDGLSDVAALRVALGCALALAQRVGDPAVAIEAIRQASTISGSHNEGDSG